MMVRSLARLFLLSAALVLRAADLEFTPDRFDDPDRRARIEQLLPQLDQLYVQHAVSNHVPGFVYGVVLDGRLIHSLAWGESALEPSRPMTLDTRFRIASMTKSFTALAILKLRDAGQLSLEDPVSRYIPEFRRVQAPAQDSPTITIRHLMKMTAGFPQDDPWGDRRLDDPVRALEALVAGGLAFSNPPGVTWEYSNLGYALLGQVVTRASRRPYQEYITREILRPLGMSQTVWEFAEVPPDRMALGYRWEHGRWIPEPLLHDGAFGAMGGLITTLEDFAKYLSLHLEAWPARDGPDAGPVRRATLREMHRPAEVLSVITNNPTLDGSVNPRVAGYSYGLSWNRDARGVMWLRHGGGLPGYGSEHRFLPAHGVGLISFANRTYAPMTAVNAGAMELLIVAAALPARRPVAPPILVKRAAQLAALLQSWDPALVAEAVSPNLFQDRAEADRRVEVEALLARCGPVRSVSPLEPENQLRGRFELVGERGRVGVRFTLMPELPPRIQEVTLEFLAGPP